jgi:hypothetical protein
MPKTIMATMATTLITANQNSVSPKARTLNMLMALASTKQPSAETQVGMSGNQYCT